MKEKVSKKDLGSAKTKARSLTGKRGKAPTKFLPGKAPASVFTASKAFLPHSTSIGTATKRVESPQCEEITIIAPTQASSAWPADGILRQALMSYGFPDQSNDGKHLSDSTLEISSDSVEVLELTQESLPMDSLSPDSIARTVPQDPQPPALGAYTVSLSKDSASSPSQLSSLLLPDTAVARALHDPASGTDLLGSVDGDGFVTIPVVIMTGHHMTPTPLAGVTLEQVTDPSGGKFCTLVSDVGRMDSSETASGKDARMTSSPATDGYVTVVYSTVPDANATTSAKFLNQKFPLPPMSDIKSSRAGGPMGTSKKTYRQSEINRIIGVEINSVPRTTRPAHTTAGHFNSPLTVDSFLKGGLQTNLVDSNVDLISPSHLIPISSVHPLLVSSLQPSGPGSDSAVTSTPCRISGTVPRKHKPVRSIQELLDSQSTGLTYTTSYCGPIMAVQDTLSGSDLFSAPAVPAAPPANANTQLHALLNNAVSNPIDSPSLHALLNNTIATSSPSGSPSLHSLLNSVASSTPLPGTSLNSLLGSGANTSTPSPFFSSSPILATAMLGGGGGADAMAYPLQSPAEILSQLKADGALPTMSSSQVSSVLSALASDPPPQQPCHMEMEVAHRHIMQQQQVQLTAGNACAAKSPSLSHADDSRLHDMTTADDLAADKSSSSKDSAEETMIVQVMNMISSEERDEAAGENVLNERATKRDSRSDVSPMIFVKQEMLQESTSQGRGAVFTGGKRHDGRRGGAPGCTAAGAARLSAWRTSVQESNFVEEVSCYKCKFCPFLSLEKTEISTHVRQRHSPRAATAPASPGDKRARLKCPGCSNVFYSPTSLKVHLSQDHQVAGEGLHMMVGVVLANSASLVKISRHKKRQRKNSTSGGGGATNHLLGDQTSTMDDATCGQGSSSDCVKIRVRNLDKEVDVGDHELAHGAVVGEQDRASAHAADVAERGHKHAHSVVEVEEVEEVEDDFHMDTDDLCSNGATGLDDGDLSQVLEEDLMAKQLKPNVDPCEYKDVKADLSGMVLCGTTAPPPPPPPLQIGGGSDDTDDGYPVPPPAKRRGRPKGSRNHQLSLNVFLPGKAGAVEMASEKDTGYKCELDGCAVRLQSHDNIEYHRRCHAGAGYACPECAHETAHWSLLLGHLWRVHSIDMELYTCAHCNYKTSSYCKLMNIHQRIHSDERPFLCDTCGKGFKNPKQMRNHKVIHTMKRLKSQPTGSLLGSCDTCGRSFNSARLLRLHQDNVHRKLRPHLCNFCGYSASSRSTLKMHMRQHTGEKPFGCDECDYRTADHNSLRRHKMRHTGDKPYKCPHCAYACIQSSTFKAHIKSKHPGQDNGLMFSCPQCPFRSVKKDNLVSHMADHEGDCRPSKEHRARPPLTAAQHQQQHKKERIKKQADSQRLPSGISIIDINNIITTEQQRAVADMSMTSSLHLIYVNAETVGEFVKSRERSLAAGVTEALDDLPTVVEMPAAEASSTAAERRGEQTIADFEPEEITGDIRDMVTIPEPGDWREVLALFAGMDAADRFYDERFLWIRPSEADLRYIGDEIGIRRLVSFGCGSGLLEWLIAAATGVSVVGIEVDRRWWESAYAPPTFLPLHYSDEPPALPALFGGTDGPHPALMFCYFNNAPAFREYVGRYAGDCVVVVGPGKGRGDVHTDPEPFDAEFPPEWSLASSREIGTTEDFIAVYRR